MTRDRATWVTSTEIALLALVLMTGPGAVARLLVGLPLLAHVGYKALTSVPFGAIPGKPTGAKAERRNQDLRSNIIGFLNEVRRVEDYAQRARIAGRSRKQIDHELRAARQRMVAAAAEAARATGQGDSVGPTLTA